MAGKKRYLIVLCSFTLLFLSSSLIGQSTLKFAPYLCTKMKTGGVVKSYSTSLKEKPATFGGVNLKVNLEHAFSRLSDRYAAGAYVKVSSYSDPKYFISESGKKYYPQDLGFTSFQGALKPEMLYAKVAVSGVVNKTLEVEVHHWGNEGQECFPLPSSIEEKIVSSTKEDVLQSLKQKISFQLIEVSLEQKVNKMYDLAAMTRSKEEVLEAMANNDYDNARSNLFAYRSSKTSSQFPVANRNWEEEMEKKIFEGLKQQNESQKEETSTEQASLNQDQGTGSSVAKAKTLANEKKFDDAISVLEKHIGSYPNDQEAKSLLSEIKLKKKFYDEEMKFKLGAEARAAESAGNKEEAKKLYRKLLELDPNNVNASQALARLERESAVSQTVAVPSTTSTVSSSQPTYSTTTTQQKKKTSYSSSSTKKKKTSSSSSRSSRSSSYDGFSDISGTAVGMAILTTAIASSVVPYSVISYKHLEYMLQDPDRSYDVEFYEHFGGRFTFEIGPQIHYADLGYYQAVILGYKAGAEFFPFYSPFFHTSIGGEGRAGYGALFFDQGHYGYTGFNRTAIGVPGFKLYNNISFNYDYRGSSSMADIWSERDIGSLGASYTRENLRNELGLSIEIEGEGRFDLGYTTHYTSYFESYMYVPKSKTAASGTISVPRYSKNFLGKRFGSLRFRYVQDNFVDVDLNLDFITKTYMLGIYGVFDFQWGY